MNVDKINIFLDSDYEEDIKDFVLKLFKIFCSKDIEIDVSHHLLLDLGIFNDDEIETHDDYYVLDYYTLSKLDKRLRIAVYKGIISELTKDNVSTDFFSDMLISMKVVVKIEDWKIKSRKNKLDKINNNEV